MRSNADLALALFDTELSRAAHVRRARIVWSKRMRLVVLDAVHRSGVIEKGRMYSESWLMNS